MDLPPTDEIGGAVTRRQVLRLISGAGLAACSTCAGANARACTGGVADKNPLLMQIYADVVGLPLSTVPSDQAPALGSASRNCC